jgi:hypothetical protein
MLANEAGSNHFELMTAVTFDQALIEFKQLYQLAASGETLIIENAEQRVALHRMGNSLEIAPAGNFADDYTEEEIAELNVWAPKVPKGCSHKTAVK